MRTGHMAIGLAAVVHVVPASYAQDSRVLDPGKSAGTEIEAEKRQTHDEMSDGLRSAPREHTGVFLEVPIGRVSLEVPIGRVSLEVPIGRVGVGPEFVDGEPVYVRRVTGKEGMTIVEVSTTPFMPEPPGVDQLIDRPDQPAPW